MPFNKQFGRRFTDLLREHGLQGLDAPYDYLQGAISKSTIQNWRRGAPAPSLREAERLRVVLAFFPEQNPDDWLDLISQAAA